ncbi:hypothetical protein ABZ702_06630 [Streptomyces cyaneofuscatus]|uniref:hypothetical protein n=1 Tax=Streptomyces cyaneofuscatus TaxID=66883 RepID=UPI0033C9E20D
MSEQLPAADLRALLDAVLDAIDIPHPATIGDTEAYQVALDRRAALAVTTARAALAENPDDIGWNADHLRRRLAEHPPTGYRSTQDAEAGR